MFSLKRCAFQTIQPVVSRKKYIFSAQFGPDGAVASSFTFSRVKRSVAPLGSSGVRSA